MQEFLKSVNTGVRELFVFNVNLTTLVSEEDYIYCIGIPLRYNGKYLYTRIEGKSIPLHKVIQIRMGIPYEIEIDHEDRNKLNNSRVNLKPSNRFANGRNSKLKSSNASGYRGVDRHRCGRWRARIRVNGKRINLGLFDTAEEAYEKYLETELLCFGFNQGD